MHNRLKFCLLLTLCCIFSGCSYAHELEMHHFTVTAVSRLQVAINGTLYTDFPAVIPLGQGPVQKVTVRLQGYYKKSFTIGHGYHGWTIAGQYWPRLPPALAVATHDGLVEAISYGTLNRILKSKSEKIVVPDNHLVVVRVDKSIATAYRVAELESKHTKHEQQ